MPGFPSDVAEQLERLPRMSAAELRSLWQETFGKPHLAWMHQGFLLRALAYHFQAKAYGGLSPSVRSRARVLVAKGTPLSVRIRFGRPYSRDRKSVV